MHVRWKWKHLLTVSSEFADAPGSIFKVPFIYIPLSSLCGSVVLGAVVTSSTLDQMPLSPSWAQTKAVSTVNNPVRRRRKKKGKAGPFRKQGKCYKCISEDGERKRKCPLYYLSNFNAWKYASLTFPIWFLSAIERTFTYACTYVLQCSFSYFISKRNVSWNESGFQNNTQDLFWAQEINMNTLRVN